MENKQAVRKFWHAYQRQCGDAARQNYRAWSFGDTSGTADQLADLVVRGLKTATTSAYELYAIDEPLPQVGEYNIILDGRGEPIAITKTVVVEIVSFQQVSWEHAYHEGEGDRSLAYWRDVHKAFFEQEYAEVHKKFTPAIPCVCEVFEVVFRKQH